MDSASPSVTSVASVGRELEQASKSVANAGGSPPVGQASQARPEAKNNNSQDGLSSDPQPPVVKANGSAQESKKPEPSQGELTKKEIEDSLKDAEKKAKQLETAFARINAPFKVSFEGSGKEINFQVIEAHSGKVIRKFPPPAAQSILDRLSIGEPGALLDESA